MDKDGVVVDLVFIVLSIGAAWAFIEMIWNV